MRSTGNGRQVGQAFREGRTMEGFGSISSYHNKTTGITTGYSYSTVVAVRHPDGRVLMTLNRYSVTTTKHCGEFNRGPVRYVGHEELLRAQTDESFQDMWGFAGAVEDIARRRVYAAGMPMRKVMPGIYGNGEITIHRFGHGWRASRDGDFEDFGNEVYAASYKAARVAAWELAGHGPQFVRPEWSDLIEAREAHELAGVASV